MQWLRIEDDENQDMEHEYIGELILEDGFKVRYTNVEVYTDSMRQKFESVFKKQGYRIKVKYNNTHASIEITAIKQKTKYLEVAIAVAVGWAVYRVYTTIN
tara:strand:- start:137 stop:439 length:303 start_codon:yes stop_codon:yes gene_type:complete